LFYERAQGCHIVDADGNDYLDFALSQGPMILGHSHPRVLESVARASEEGQLFAGQHRRELELAEEIQRAVPCAELMRFSLSGSEAVHAALRVARAWSGRNRFIRFEGHYHGWFDNVAVGIGPELWTQGLPRAAGDESIVLPWNDLAAVEKALAQADVAAVIAEPVMANIGVIPPRDGFLKSLRSLTTRRDALLVFDEVVTGFRLAMGGAQEFYDIRADLVTLGKIAGGGMPVGVVAGPERIMSLLSPEGEVYNAGTFNGNPMTMAAGIAALRALSGGRIHPHLARLTEQLTRGLYDAMSDRREAGDGFRGCANAVTGMITMFFAPGVRNAAEARGSDVKRYMRFHRAMMDEGFWLPPSQFEAWFLSGAHTPEDVDRFCEAVEEHL
jgi:glutamate-1-semialdehyde 2,1-aminomutase